MKVCRGKLCDEPESLPRQTLSEEIEQAPIIPRLVVSAPRHVPPSSIELPESPASNRAYAIHNLTRPYLSKDRSIIGVYRINATPLPATSSLSGPPRTHLTRAMVERVSLMPIHQ